MSSNNSTKTLRLKTFRRFQTFERLTRFSRNIAMLMMFLLYLPAGELIQAQDSTLVLYLDAESDFQDKSGHGNHGTATNVTFVDAPWGGKAFKFDGDGYIEIPDVDSSLDLKDEFTIEIMAKALADSGVVIGKTGFSDYPKQFVIGFAGYSYNYGCSGRTDGLGSTNLGEWKKITFIAKGNSVKFFLDNQFNGTLDYDDYWNSCFTSEDNDEPLRIGVGFITDPYGSTKYFNGLIDEIRIYKRALTPSELQPIPSVVTKTEITGGDINQDSTWSLVDSPFLISGDVRVKSGATLTIEPGVEIYFDRGNNYNIGGWESDHIEFIIHGRLTAVGTVLDTIRFADRYGSRDQNSNGSWARIRFQNGSSRGEFEYVSFQHAFDQAIRIERTDSLKVTHCSFSNNNNGIYFNYRSDNTVKDQIIVEHNTFSNNYTAILVNPGYGDLELDYNTFLGSSWSSIYPQYYNSSGNTLILRNNNFYNQLNRTIIYNDWTNSIDARYNYWGTETTAEIDTGINPKNLSRITDYYDDSNRGEVDYSHWLDAPYPGGNPVGATYSAEILISDNLYTDEMLTYRSGDSIFIQITDEDRNTDALIPNEITLNFWSDLETTPDSIILTETDNESGIFRNYIILDDASGISFIDGKLQVNHGDWMYFQYIDPADDWGNVDTVLMGKIFELTINNGYNGQSIEGDTVWTKANSPYLLTGDVNISSNGSLTIEPTVRVYFEPHRDDNSWSDQNRINIVVDNGAQIRAIGSESDSIYFLGYTLNQKPSLWSEIRIQQDINQVKKSKIQYARIEGGDYSIRGYGVELLNTTITNSKFAVDIWGNNDSYEISIIKNCTFYDNSEQDIHAGRGAKTIIENNDFRVGVKFYGSIYLYKPRYLKIRNNNFYLVSINSSWDSRSFIFDIKYNYWGTTATAEMNLGNNPKNISTIYDYYDDTNRGTVNYSRWLDAPWPDGTPAPGGYSGTLQFTYSDSTPAWGYQEGDTLYVQLFDPDLNTDINTPDVATINIWSGLETNPEQMFMNEVSADTGLFMGWMLLDGNTGYAMSDGILQVDLNNKIFASYTDALDDWNNTDTTAVDSVIYGLSIQEYAPDSNTVLLLHFNEGGGQTISDSSSFGVNGQLGSTLITDSNDPNWISGVSGKALSFDGIDDYVIFPDPTQPIIGDKITVEMWVNFQWQNWEGNKWFLGKSCEGVPNRKMGIYMNGSFQFASLLHINNKESEPNLSQTEPIEFDRWYHLALTYDGSYMKFYIDGDSVGSYQVSGQLTLFDDRDFYLGSNYCGNQNTKLYIDEVRISNIARTSFNTTGPGLAPGKVNDLAIVDSTSNYIVLKWHAPGDDSYTGTAAQYDLRYSTSPIDSANFAQADSVAGLPAPSAAGKVDTIKVTSLTYNTSYYFALKTRDSDGNWSEISNLATGITEPQDLVPPDSVITLAVADTGKRKITLNWTAPADDGSSGRRIHGYRIYYSSSSFSDTSLTATDSIEISDNLKEPGATESFTKSGLDPNTTYYFALKAYDEVPNWSSLSNIVQITTLPVPVLVTGGWPSFHGGGQNSGYFPGIGSTIDSLHWAYATAGQISSSPAVDKDENIYVGSEDGYLYALDKAGTLLWKKSLGSGVFSSPLLGTKGRVYVGSKDKKIYCLSTATGDTVWTYTTGSQVYSSPLLSQAGVLFIGSMDGKLYAFQSDDGKLLWSYSTGSKIYNSPALSPDERAVYFGTQGGKVIAVDADSGSKSWEFSTGSAVYSSPAVDDSGNVYVAAQNGKVYSLDSTGTKSWEFDTGSSIFYSSPALDKSQVAGAGVLRVLVGADNGKLYCIDAAGGTEVWSYQTAGSKSIRNSPAVASNGFIYFGSADKKFYCLTNTGVLEWSHAMDGEIYTSSPAFGPSGRIYIGAYDNKLYSIGFKRIFTTSPLLTAGQEYSGDVEVPYNVLNPLSTTVAILCEYSVDTGESWTAAALTGDTTGITPTQYTGGHITWHSADDLPGKYITTAQFRITAYDPDSTGVPGVSPTFIVDNNAIPTITVSPVEGEQSGTITLAFTFSDSEHDTLSVSGEYMHTDSNAWNSALIPGVIDTFTTSPGSATWASGSDLKDRSGDYYLRLYMNDNDSSIPDTITVSIDNYHNQSIALADFTGEQQDSITISYVITDSTGDTINLFCEYRLPDSTQWVSATVIGDTTDIDSGSYDGKLIWNSAEDIGVLELTGVQFRITPNDGWDAGTADTVLIDLDNNLNPSVVVTPIETEQTGDIAVSYQLSDPENDALAITCEIKKYGETAWAPATVSGATTGITTYSNTITWNSDSDLTDYIGYVDFRITPRDKDIGTADTVTILVDQIGAPITKKLSVPFGELSKDIILSFELSDDEGDSIDLFYEYTIDEGTTWSQSKGISRYGPGDYSGSFTWKSYDDLPGVDLYNVIVRLLPWDGHWGAIKETIPFHLDNNLPPEVSITAFSNEQSGDIPLNITLSDAEDDSIVLGLQYSISGTDTWNAISSTDIVSPIKPSLFTGIVTWNSDTDLHNRDVEIQLKVETSDLDIGESDTISFKVDNETGPQIVDIFPEKNTTMAWHKTIELSFSKSLDTTTLTGNVTLEGNITGNLNPAFNLSNTNKTLELSTASPLMTADTFNIAVLTGLKDIEGIPFDGNGNGDPDIAEVDNLSWSFYTCLPGDYNLDQTINLDDFITFRDSWLNQSTSDPKESELYPFTGSLPEIMVQPDGVLDIHDFASFGWMWTWSQEQGLGRIANVLAKEHGNTPPPLIITSNYETENVWNATFSEFLELSLRLTGDKPLNALEFMFRYDPQLLEFVQVSYPQAPDVQEVFHLDYHSQEENTVVLDLVSMDQGLGNDQPLAVLIFKPRNPGQAELAFSVDSRQMDDSRKPVLSTGSYRFNTEPPVPKRFALHENYPNPFNPVTNIRYELPVASQVLVNIYDLLGREVITLVNKIQPEGYYEVRWEGKDQMGNQLGSGIYFYLLQAQSNPDKKTFRKVRKMVLLK